MGFNQVALLSLLIALTIPLQILDISKMLANDKNGTMMLSIMKFSIMTLNINGLYVTLSISDTQHK